MIQESDQCHKRSILDNGAGNACCYSAGLEGAVIFQCDKASGKLWNNAARTQFNRTVIIKLTIGVKGSNLKLFFKIVAIILRSTKFKDLFCSSKRPVTALCEAILYFRSE